MRPAGGEPFLRTDLSQIVHLVQEKLRPLAVHITSNGLLAERIARFCLRRHTDIPLHLLISLDGMRERHNHTRVVASAWERAVITLMNLAPLQEELNLRLVVNQTVVDPSGLDDVRTLHDFLAPYDIRHHVVMAYDGSAIYDVDDEVVRTPSEPGRYATYGDFSEQQMEHLLDELDGQLREALISPGLLNRPCLKRGRRKPSPVSPQPAHRAA